VVYFGKIDSLFDSTNFVNTGRGKNAERAQQNLHFQITLHWITYGFLSILQNDKADLFMVSRIDKNTEDNLISQKNSRQFHPVFVHWWQHAFSRQRLLTLVVSLGHHII